MTRQAMTARWDSAERRRFLTGVGTGAAALLVATRAPARANADHDDVSPTEDLMREHGVLRRLLLIYGEAIRRVDANEDLRSEPIAHAATIIRDFIEGYHERDEEEYIFPRFRKAGRMVDLVNTLTVQHEAGRKLTANILRWSATTGTYGPSDRPRAAQAMRLFTRMYEPHAAREDTVLFPAFRDMVGPKELARLQDVFEDKERSLPGGGFEKMVAEVTAIEQAMGISELARFTPKII